MGIFNIKSQARKEYNPIDPPTSRVRDAGYLRKATLTCSKFSRLLHYFGSTRPSDTAPRGWTAEIDAAARNYLREEPKKDIFEIWGLLGLRFEVVRAMKPQKVVHYLQQLEQS